MNNNYTLGEGSSNEGMKERSSFEVRCIDAGLAIPTQDEKVFSQTAMSDDIDISEKLSSEESGIDTDGFTDSDDSNDEADVETLTVETGFKMSEKPYTTTNCSLENTPGENGPTITSATAQDSVQNSSNIIQEENIKDLKQSHEQNDNRSCKKSDPKNLEKKNDRGCERKQSKTRSCRSKGSNDGCKECFGMKGTRAQRRMKSGEKKHENSRSRSSSKSDIPNGPRDCDRSKSRKYKHDTHFNFKHRFASRNEIRGNVFKFKRRPYYGGRRTQPTKRFHRVQEKGKRDHHKSSSSSTKKKDVTRSEASLNNQKKMDPGDATPCQRHGSKCNRGKSNDEPCNKKINKKFPRSFCFASSYNGLTREQHLKNSAKWCSQPAPTVSQENGMETEQELKQDLDNDIDVVNCSEDDCCDAFQTPNNEQGHTNLVNSCSKKPMTSKKIIMETKQELEQTIFEDGCNDKSLSGRPEVHSPVPSDNNCRTRTENTNFVNSSMSESLFSLFNGTNWNAPNSFGRLILNQLLQEYQYRSFDAAIGSSGVQEPIPRNNLMHPVYNLASPRAASTIESTSHVIMNGNGTVPILGDTTNKTYFPLDNFDTVRIIPTERRNAVGVACKIPKEIDTFKFPELIDLPTTCHQSIYHFLPNHIIEKCSLYDPRREKCKVVTFKPDESGNASKTDIVSTIIKSSQIPLVEILKRNDMHLQNKPKKAVQMMDKKPTPTTGSCFPMPVKPSVRDVDSDSVNENVSINVMHEPNVDKNMIVSVLEEFGKIERPLSPPVSDASTDDDDDDFDYVDSNVEYDYDDADNGDNDGSDNKDDVDEMKDDMQSTDAEGSCSYADGHFHKDIARVGYPGMYEKTNVFSVEIEHHRLSPESEIDGDDEDTPVVQCHEDDLLLSFLNFTSNNPYGNEDSDLLATRDGSESVTPEDDDAPMQDEMSSPILLNACDRVYHIKGDRNTEQNHNPIYSAESCPSWNSRGSEDEFVGHRTDCHSSDLWTRDNRNSNTDLLGQAMHSAGINDQTIDTLLSSNTAVESCFCEDDLYFKFCAQLNESRSTVVPPPQSTAITLSDSCLPSTSSYIQSQFLSQSELNDSEIASLLGENSQLLNLDNHYNQACRYQFDFGQENHQSTSMPFSVGNVKADSNELFGGYNDCQFITSNQSDKLCNDKDCKWCSLKLDETKADCGPMNLDWDSLDFIEDTVVENHGAKYSAKIHISPSLDEGKCKGKEKRGAESNMAKPDIESREYYVDDEAPSDNEKEFLDTDVEFDFNIGGVIVEGSSKERRSRRIRTLEEVKNFDKKYIVPRIVIDDESQVTTADPRKTRKRKASTLSSTKSNRGRKPKNDSTKGFISDETVVSEEITSRHNDVDDNVESSPENTRILRSSTRAKSQNGNGGGVDDVVDKTDGPMSSVVTKRKRGRSKSGKYLSKNTKDKPKNTIRDAKTSTPFTAHVFKATIRPAKVVVNGAAKPHKYQLFPRVKRHRCCYVLHAASATVKTRNAIRLEEESTCRNNNADGDESGDDTSHTSGQISEMDMKAMKRKLRQKDKDLDKYYSRSQKCPERSSFVNSMIQTRCMKRGLQSKEESKNGGANEVTNDSSTLPVDDELKLSLSQLEVTPRMEESIHPPDSDLKPCVLRFVRRMMGCYGDYFSDSADASSRERRLRLCSTYLKRHGIKTDSLSQFQNQRESHTSNVNDESTNSPTSSSDKEDMKSETKLPMKFHPETKEYTREKEFPETDTTSIKQNNFDEKKSNETFDEGKESRYSPLPKIKDWRNSQDSLPDYQQTSTQSHTHYEKTIVKRTDDDLAVSDRSTKSMENTDIDGRVITVEDIKNGHSSKEIEGVPRETQCTDHEMPLSGKSEDLEFEGPMSSQSLSLESRFKTRDKTQGENSEDVLSSFAHDTDVADMLDDIKEKVAVGQQVTVGRNEYDKGEFYGHAHVGDGDALIDNEGYEFDENDDESDVEMVKKDRGMGDFCENGDEVLDYQFSEKDETDATTSGTKYADVDDEMTPLSSLEHIAKEAEKDFNSTIAGSLLNLETASECPDNDLDTKFRSITFNRSSIRFMNNSKRSTLLQRLGSYTKLSTIQEEEDDDDDDDEEGKNEDETLVDND